MVIFASWMLRIKRPSTLFLFLLCVRSNCGYIPVAEFIIEHETVAAVAEVLQVLLSWNPTWEPPYFMIDFS